MFDVLHNLYTQNRYLRKTKNMANDLMSYQIKLFIFCKTFFFANTDFNRENVFITVCLTEKVC